MQLIVSTMSLLGSTQLQLDCAKIIPQSASIGSQNAVLDAKNLLEYQRVLKPQNVLRLDPISALSLTHLLKSSQDHQESAILHPVQCLDSTTYHYLIQSMTSVATQMRAYGLKAYGHPFGELIRYIIRFSNEHNFSYDQLQLLCEQINKVSHVFLIGHRSAKVEPTVAKVQCWITNTTSNYTIYEALDYAWQRCSRVELKQTIAESLQTETLMWIESCNGANFEKSLLQQLSQWGIRDPKFLRHSQLNFCDASLPDQFVLLSLIPNKKRLAQLCDWVIQTV